MPKSVNKVILLGNVGKDPEVKFLPSGLPVANLTLATSDRFKDKAGEWQDRTEWHNLTAYQRVAEIIRDYVKKGSKLYVEGRIQTRSWDDQASGQKKYRTEIIVNDVVLLSGRGEGEVPAAVRARIPLPSINGRRCTTRSLPVPKSPTTIFRSDAGSVPASTRGDCFWDAARMIPFLLAPLTNKFRPRRSRGGNSFHVVPTYKMRQLMLESAKCPLPRMESQILPGCHPA